MKRMIKITLILLLVGMAVVAAVPFLIWTLVCSKQSRNV